MTSVNSWKRVRSVGRRSCVDSVREREGGVACGTHKWSLSLVTSVHEDVSAAIHVLLRALFPQPTASVAGHNSKRRLVTFLPASSQYLGCVTLFRTNDGVLTLNKQPRRHLCVHCCVSINVTMSEQVSHVFTLICMALFSAGYV